MSPTAGPIITTITTIITMPDKKEIPMIAKTLLSALFALTPALAMAHGGHPETGSHHAFVHLLWFGLPALLIAGVVVRSVLRRQ
jgi:hypothetical protein